MPKGTPEKDEKPIETARRELFEETGLKDVKITSKQTFLETYTFELRGITYKKTNMYYVCFVNQMIKGNNLDEIDEIRWVTFDEARITLTHDSAVAVVDKLESYLIA